MVEVTKQGGKERLLVSFELGPEKWKLAFAKDLSSPKQVREIAARELSTVKLEITKARKTLGLTEKAAEGVANDEEFDEAYAVLQAFADDPESVLAMPRVWQVWGYKS